MRFCLLFINDRCYRLLRGKVYDEIEKVVARKQKKDDLKSTLWSDRIYVGCLGVN